MRSGLHGSEVSANSCRLLNHKNTRNILAIGHRHAYNGGMNETLMAVAIGLLVMGVIAALVAINPDSKAEEDRKRRKRAGVSRGYSSVASPASDSGSSAWFDYGGASFDSGGSGGCDSSSSSCDSGGCDGGGGCD